jgi:hypothetical protein
MNRDDIIRMAREAGMHSAVLLHIYEGKEAALTDSEQDELRRLARFAALVAAAERERIIAANAPEIERINAHIKELEQARLEEREACARVCEGRLQEGLNFEGCAAAIRARGQQRPEPTYPSDPIWREQKRLEMEAWARNKLARHGIQLPDEDEEYGNPSF